MIRRACSIAFVTSIVLAVGCSYDFSIGTGSVVDASSSGTSSDSPPDVVDAATQQDASANADTGTAAPTTGECGRTCVCKGKDRCRFTCTRPPCNLECSDESNCAMDCARGGMCAISCTGKTQCDLNCRNGASCSFECKDQAECTGQCKSGSVCTRDCPRNNCTIDCAGGLCP